MIRHIPHTDIDEEKLRTIEVDPASQENDFFDYSKVVVRKPWGYEYLAFQNDHAAVWVLFLKNGHRTSMHCHPRKVTSLLVIDGDVEFSTVQSCTRASAGACFFIDKATFHQTCAVSEHGAIVMEIEMPVNKRDLVRLKDAYGRERMGYEGQEHMSYNTDNYNHFSLAGPDVYYEQRKRFGTTGITLIRCDNDDSLQQRLCAECPTYVVPFDGHLTQFGARLEPGIVAEFAKGDIHSEGDCSALLITLNDNRERASDYLCSAIADNGITAAFMVAGQRNTHLVDAVVKNNRMQYLFFHSEQAAMNAAIAYAKLCGKPGLCVVSSGASSTNAITGVAIAWTDSVPVLVLSGQSKLSESSSHYALRQYGIEELSIVPLVASLTKYAVSVSNSKNLAQHISAAMGGLRDRRAGPVWLDIPLDVQHELITVMPIVRETQNTTPVDIASTVELLRHAKRPLLLIGNGVRIACAQLSLLKVLERLAIPVVTSKNGKDLLPDAHPQLVGMMGAYGDRAANFAVQNCDVLVCIGSRLSLAQIGVDHTSFARNAKRVVVDIDPAELRKPSAKPDVAVNADAKTFIEALATVPIETRWDAWCGRCADWKRRYARKLTLSDETAVNGVLDLYEFIGTLAASCTEDAVITLDAGTSSFAVPHGFAVRKQRIIGSSALQTPGFAIPAAIGAHLSNRSLQVIAVCGDAGFLQSSNELSLIGGLAMPIKIFVLDNQGNATLRKTQEAYFKGKHVGTDSKSGKPFLSVESVAAATGMPTVKAGSLSQVRAALAAPGPGIIIVPIASSQYPEPRLVSSVTHEGKMQSLPIEDMYPFLDREELAKNMKVDE